MRFATLAFAVLLVATSALAHRERRDPSPIRPGPVPDLNRVNSRYLVVCKASSKPTKAVLERNAGCSSAVFFAAGARLDHHSRFGNHVSPRLSAAYQLGDRWRVRGAAGSAFRAPSAGDASRHTQPGPQPTAPRVRAASFPPTLRRSPFICVKPPTGCRTS